MRGGPGGSARQLLQPPLISLPFSPIAAIEPSILPPTQSSPTRAYSRPPVPRAPLCGVRPTLRPQVPRNRASKFLTKLALHSRSCTASSSPSLSSRIASSIPSPTQSPPTRACSRPPVPRAPLCGVRPTLRPQVPRNRASKSLTKLALHSQSCTASSSPSFSSFPMWACSRPPLSPPPTVAKGLRG